MKRAYLQSFALILSVAQIGGAGVVAANVVTPTQLEPIVGQGQLDQLTLEQPATPQSTQLAGHSSHSSHVSHGSHCSSYSYC